jgi:hypothetical protein
VLPPGGQPATDGAGVDAEEVSDLGGILSLDNALHGQQAPTFQFERCADGSHARLSSQPYAARALLSSELIARLPNTLCRGLEEVGLPVFSPFSALQRQLIFVGKLLETLHLPQSTQTSMARSWENCIVSFWQACMNHPG